MGHHIEGVGNSRGATGHNAAGDHATVKQVALHCVVDSEVSDVSAVRSPGGEGNRHRAGPISGGANPTGGVRQATHAHRNGARNFTFGVVSFIAHPVGDVVGTVQSISGANGQGRARGAHGNTVAGARRTHQVNRGVSKGVGGIVGHVNRGGFTCIHTHLGLA